MTLTSKKVVADMSLALYLAELKKIVLLTREEEQDLWQGYKENGDLFCRQRLIESYQPLVFKLAMRWHLNEALLLDIVQEGTVGLIEAVEGFDHKRGIAFSLYAVHRIRGRMLNFLEHEGAHNELYADSPFTDREDAGCLADLFVDENAEIAAQIEQNYLLAQVKSALERLPPKEQMIITGVFVDEWEPKQLAASLDVSLSYIYRLQKKGIRRLRGMLSKLMGNW